jgi:cytochrome c556
MGKVNGEPGIESVYFIQDTRAEAKDADLKQFKQFKTMFYKKEVKNYFKDQPQIWSDFDKFVFDKNKFAESVKEFNKFYEVSE